MGTTPWVLRLSHYHWGLEEILECSFLESMKTISLGGYLVSVSLIFHKELSWPLVVTTLTLAPPSSVNIRAGPDFYVKPSNSPRMHEEFLFSKQKRFNYTPIYEYYTAESITRDCKSGKARNRG